MRQRRADPREGQSGRSSAIKEQGLIGERDAENARRRAIRQLERLGHTVTLGPLAEAA